jgi:hypothetical protein
VQWQGWAAPAAVQAARCTLEVPVSTNTILIVLVLVLLFGGGGFFWSRR